MSILIKTVVLGIILFVVFCNLGCLYHKSEQHSHCTPTSQSIYVDHTIQAMELFFDALKHYACDVATFPNKDSLLKDLLENPGINTWNGPYITNSMETITELLSTKSIIEILDHCTIKIIIAGEDGEFGTNDDIIGEYQFEKGETYTRESLFIKSHGVVWRDYVENGG